MVEIRPFEDGDAALVEDLFVRVNRELAPPDMREAFEAYIARSLAEEMGRIAEYYQEHGGGFWVARQNDRIAGMFGLERCASDAMELRRMYVDRLARRTGLGRAMLRYAEAECRRRDVRRVELSTSELQPAALALYKSEGYRLMREASADRSSNKTVGGGILRYYFEKDLA